MAPLAPITAAQMVTFSEDIKDPITIVIEPVPVEPGPLVESITKIEGPLDVYCWYEGYQSLPVSGAIFMKREILAPLYEKKKDVTVFLYSLKGWDFEKKVSDMNDFSRIGKAISQIQTTAIRCMYASEFFKYCAQIKEKERGLQEETLYSYLQQELPKKQWLIQISEKFPEKKFTVGQLFNSESSLLDCLYDTNAGLAYSQIQYVEGYYLIRRSLERAIIEDRKEIKVAFVLANDEGKYYVDYPEEIKKLLKLDFGEKLNGMRIEISFSFFIYRENLQETAQEAVIHRTYIDKRNGALVVKPREVASYFDYLSMQSSSKGGQ